MLCFRFWNSTHLRIFWATRKVLSPRWYRVQDLATQNTSRYFASNCIHFAKFAMCQCMQSCSCSFVLIYSTGFRGVLIHLSFWMKNNQQSLVFASGEERSRREEIKLQDIQRRWVASNRWAEAAQFALARSLTSSHSDLLSLEAAEGNNILRRTKDAVITLQSVLEGKHNSEIDESLNQYQVPADRWWSSLYKVIEGMVVS